MKDEITELRKALEEPRLYPRDPDEQGDWVIDHDFLNRLSQRVRDYGGSCAMWQIEVVLLCAEELLGEGDSDAGQGA